MGVSATVADVVGSSFAGDAAFTLGADAAASVPALATAAGAADATATALAGTGTVAGGLTSTMATGADAAAQSVGYSSAADALSAGTDPTLLGLPAGTTASAVQAAGGAAMSPAYIQAANASGLSGLLGTASTGSQIIGGLGQLAKGYQSLQAGKAVTPQQASPLSQYMPGYAAQLNQLIQNPSTITTTPGYQFNLSNYMQQLQAKQAQQGSLAGGGALVQAGQMGQQYATSSLAQQEALLQQLTNMAPSQATSGTSTALNNAAATNQGINALSTGIGQVLNPLATLYSQYNTSSPSA